MSIRALDCYRPDLAAANAQAIGAAGYQAVGAYLFESSAFKHLLTKQHAQTLAMEGVSVFTIFENGSPTSAGYFNAARGGADAEIAHGRAMAAGQPADTPIFFTVDYDASVDDLTHIVLYFEAVRERLIELGSYGRGCYGSGLVLSHLTGLGLISATYLSGSRGFSGYADWTDRADIVQGEENTRVLGMDSDLDTINNAAVCWQPTD